MPWLYASSEGLLLSGCTVVSCIQKLKFLTGISSFYLWFKYKKNRKRLKQNTRQTDVTMKQPAEVLWTVERLSECIFQSLWENTTSKEIKASYFFNIKITHFIAIMLCLLSCLHMCIFFIHNLLSKSSYINVYNMFAMWYEIIISCLDANCSGKMFNCILNWSHACFI